MEYLDGENLSDVIARGAVPAERAVTIAIELCAFLEAAHSFEAVIEGRKLRSLVHGDLKPQNVRITSDGSVKVLDFGIAKALSLSRKVTRNDFGTRPYLSPERLDGDGDVDEFADLWAVGVMLYEMIRGTRPYDAPDTQRLERIIRSRRPPQPLDRPMPGGSRSDRGKAARSDPGRALRECARHSRGPGAIQIRRTNNCRGTGLAGSRRGRGSDAPDARGRGRRRGEDARRRPGSDAAHSTGGDSAATSHLGASKPGELRVARPGQHSARATPQDTDRVSPGPRRAGVHRVLDVRQRVLGDGRCPKSGGERGRAGLRRARGILRGPSDARRAKQSRVWHARPRALADRAHAHARRAW